MRYAALPGHRTPPARTWEIPDGEGAGGGGDQTPAGLGGKPRGWPARGPPSARQQRSGRGVAAAARPGPEAGPRETVPRKGQQTPAQNGHAPRRQGRGPRGALTPRAATLPGGGRPPAQGASSPEGGPAHPGPLSRPHPGTRRQRAAHDLPGPGGHRYSPQEETEMQKYTGRGGTHLARGASGGGHVPASARARTQTGL